MQKILLLHGATGSKEQLKELEDSLSPLFEVYNINLLAHGGSFITDHPFSIQYFAEHVIGFLDQNNIRQTNIFGYSMGGYIGMFLARHYPERIDKLVTLATKFHWNEAIAAKEIKMLDAEKIEQKLPAFATTLKMRHHPEDWRIVLKKTADMLTEMGHNIPLNPEDYECINHPVMVMLGDRDKMVTLDETLEVYNTLSNGSLSVIPGTPHPFESINIKRLVFEISSFLS